MGTASGNSPGNKALIERLALNLPPPPDNPDHAVRLFTLDGQQLVVKYERQESGRHWREWVSSLACLVLFGVRVAPGKLRPGNLQFEAERMQQLAQQGFDVPAAAQARLSGYALYRH